MIHDDMPLKIIFKRPVVWAACALVVAVLSLLFWGICMMKPADFCRQQAVHLRFSETESLNYRFIREGKVKLDFVALLPLPASAAPKPSSSGHEMNIYSSEEGTLCLKPYRQARDLWIVGARILDYTYKNNDAKTPSDSDDAHKISPCPFWFEMTGKGKISGIHFNASLSESEKLHILSLLYELQLTFPAAPNCTWQASQQDAMGDYDAAYRITDATKDGKRIHLEKIITVYKNNELAKTKFSPAAMAAKIVIGKDKMNAEIRPDGGWIETIFHEQTTRIVSDGKNIGETSTRFKAEKYAGSPGAFPAGLNEFMGMMAACIPPKRVTDLYRTDPELDAMAQGRDLQSALDFFLKKTEKEEYLDHKQAEMFLVNFLKLHPKETFGIIRFIDMRKSNHLTDRQELALWNALALAGHREAQQAMLNALTGSAFNTQTRVAASLHLFNLAYPEPFLADALWKMQQNKPAGETGIHERQIRSTALFALGAMANNVNISEDMRASIVANLSEQLRRAEKPEETVNALLAIGNSRRPEFMTQAQSYLGSIDQNVRMEAFKAISRLDDPRAFDIISENFPSEKNVSVKSSILKAVNNMPSSEQIMAFYRREAQNETDNALLHPMAGNLARNLKNYPENKEALNAIINKKPSGQVLKEIYRYVSPDQLK